MAKAALQTIEARKGRYLTPEHCDKEHLLCPPKQCS